MDQIVQVHVDEQVLMHSNRDRLRPLQVIQHDLVMHRIGNFVSSACRRTGARSFITLSGMLFGLRCDPFAVPVAGPRWM